MTLFGYQLTLPWRKAVSSTVPYSGYGWGGDPWLVREPYAGAWQRNDSRTRSTILAFSAVYACVAMIADDISKLELRLIELTDDGIWVPVEDRASPFLPVLAKPNDYQTRQQFVSQWITTKLLHGNAHILKSRDARTIVNGLHVLPPLTTIPKVAQPSGRVFYDLSQDVLAGVNGADQVPATEIIHDRCITPFHPLIGVSPIYACGSSALQGMSIQDNADKFFRNQARASGHLSSDREISDEYADKLKRRFLEATTGDNYGKIVVTGAGLKFEQFTIPAADAQLIEQLQWTAVDVARCFKVPPYKIGAAQEPKFANYSAMNQDYYSQTLQAHIEAMEALLTEGLGLSGIVNGHNYAVELNLDGLLRMDPLSRADLAEKSIKAGWLSPNEARAIENRPPVDGGETPYLQQQNWPLEVLAERDPPTTTPAQALPPPAPGGDGEGNGNGGTPPPTPRGNGGNGEEGDGATAAMRLSVKELVEHLERLELEDSL